MAAPMPRVPPVTKATRPTSFSPTRDGDGLVWVVMGFSSLRGSLHVGRVGQREGVAPFLLAGRSLAVLDDDALGRELIYAAVRQRELLGQDLAAVLAETRGHVVAPAGRPVEPDRAAERPPVAFLVRVVPEHPARLDVLVGEHLRERQHRGTRHAGTV